jgi:hypothetical protein
LYLSFLSAFPDVTLPPAGTYLRVIKLRCYVSHDGEQYG